MLGGTGHHYTEKSKHQPGEQEEDQLFPVYTVTEPGLDIVHLVHLRGPGQRKLVVLGGRALPLMIAHLGQM